MFLGHFAVGYGAKKLYPKPSLGTYFIAAQFLDLLWPTLLLTGAETVEISQNNDSHLPLTFTSYPYSHSLLMVLGWSFAFGLIYWLVKRDRTASIVLAFCVLSHWLLDLLVHVPDLPLFPGNSPLVGLGLWKSFPMEMILEVLLFMVGTGLYYSSTRAVNTRGKVLFWALAIFLLAIHVANAVGPKPENVSAVAWAGHLQWLLVLFAYWTDSNRRSTTAIPSQA